MALWWNLSGLVLKPRLVHLRLVSLLSRLRSCHSKASSNSGKGGLVENTLISRSWMTIIRCLHGAACQMTQTPRKKREADFHCYLAPLISSLPDIVCLHVVLILKYLFPLRLSTDAVGAFFLIIFSMPLHITFVRLASDNRRRWAVWPFSCLHGFLTGLHVLTPFPLSG